MFVRSVVPGGPADNGLRGLLEGDIVLKVNRTPCPLGPRTLVVDLIRATPQGEPLVMVVCRTPVMPRKAMSHNPMPIAEEESNGGAATQETAVELDRQLWIRGLI